MATLSGGILGTVSGKVAGVVAGQWKDKNYIRKHTIPANPNTINQQEQRGKFGSAVSFGKLILGQVINPFIDPFQRSMSGFNFFIKQNIAYFTETVDWSRVMLTFGKLFMSYPAEPTYSNNNVVVTFSTAVGTNGLATDKISACVVLFDNFDQISKVAFSSAQVLRSTGTISIPIGSLPAATSCRVFLWASQYDLKGSLLLVSDSTQIGGIIEP